jgi:Uma2 family endonuclease
MDGGKERTMAYGARRHRFNVEQYEAMIATGILTENDRVELLEGEIFDMGPHGDAHVLCAMRLIRLCSACVGEDLWVSVNDPLLIYEESKPRPDLIIHRSAPEFELAVPSHENALVVMEIADLSLEYDRDKKLPLYGKWQIPESWLFDVARRRIERHTEPGLDGYTRVEIVQGYGSLTSTAVPGLAISVVATMG